MTDRIDPDNVTLQEAPLGYSILVRGELAGSIEGVPGQLEHIEMETHWEGRGVARAAIRELIELSRRHGCSPVSYPQVLTP